VLHRGVRQQGRLQLSTLKVLISSWLEHHTPPTPKIPGFDLSWNRNIQPGFPTSRFRYGTVSDVKCGKQNQIPQPRTLQCQTSVDREIRQCHHPRATQWVCCMQAAGRHFRGPYRNTPFSMTARTFLKRPLEGRCHPSVRHYPGSSVGAHRYVP
jgi:hypothetical protein